MMMVDGGTGGDGRRITLIPC